MYINILFTTFDLLFILQAVHFLLRCALGPCFSSPMEYVPTIRSSHCPGLGGHISTNYLWWPVYMWISISAGLNQEDSRPKQKFIASVHFLFVFFFCLISYKIFSAPPDIELSHFWPYYSFRPGAVWGWVWPRCSSKSFHLYSVSVLLYQYCCRTLYCSR